MTLEEIWIGISTGVTTINQKKAKQILAQTTITIYEELLYEGIRQVTGISQGSESIRFTGQPAIYMPSRSLVKLLADEDLLHYKDKQISLN